MNSGKKMHLQRASTPINHSQHNSIVQFGSGAVFFYIDQQASFSADCSQFPSLSCNLVPKTAHFPNVQPATVPRNNRRPNWTCPECQRNFDNSDQFKAHFEPCWVYAVERELRQQAKESFEFSSLEGKAEEASLAIGQSYRVGTAGEEIHFDGEPTLLSSKSAAISLFVSLESHLKQKTDCVNGKNKKNTAAERSKSFFEKVECPVCGKRLFRHNLLVHHRIHTGDSPFVCAFCGKKFRTSSARRIHHRSHTGEKPYICSFCQYAGTTKRNLERHVHNVHFSIHSAAQNAKGTERENELAGESYAFGDNVGLENEREF